MPTCNLWFFLPACHRDSWPRVFEVGMRTAVVPSLCDSRTGVLDPGGAEPQDSLEAQTRWRFPACPRCRSFPCSLTRRCCAYRSLLRPRQQGDHEEVGQPPERTGRERPPVHAGKCSDVAATLTFIARSPHLLTRMLRSWPARIEQCLCRDTAFDGSVVTRRGVGTGS